MSQLDDATWTAMEERAIAVRAHAHAPYSNYFVGACLITVKGEFYAGCNVENASYGLALCAERSAVASMVAAGAGEPIAIAIVTQGEEAGSPCGMCRQVLAEFALDLEVRLIALGPPVHTRTTSLSQLLPDAFRASVLRKAQTLG
jgi:cytidine deaminase